MFIPPEQIIPTGIETFKGFKALFLYIKQNPLNQTSNTTTIATTLTTTSTNSTVDLTSTTIYTSAITITTTNIISSHTKSNASASKNSAIFFVFIWLLPHFCLKFTRINELAYWTNNRLLMNKRVLFCFNDGLLRTLFWFQIQKRVFEIRQSFYIIFSKIICKIY